MVPILGKPVREYLIDHLASHGINEIMINVAYHHQRIEEYFDDGSSWGVEIGYSYEGVRDHGDILPMPMGSTGGMRRIQDFSGFFDETTLVLCGDALIDLDITAAIKEYKANCALASIGIYIFESEVLSLVPQRKVCDIGAELFRSWWYRTCHFLCKTGPSIGLTSAKSATIGRCCSVLSRGRLPT
ncbi:sugar phosphate nucleotidyltransferase [Rhodoferax sp.]|uniref:nucleotidyltransferase family protein n=1 Tax=Rhodoferax sp. TaxID=50421 RepID=UPI0025D180D7|nr:sugar phosphate nucleotidyltransferase [Rhodoferax sp.]